MIARTRLPLAAVVAALTVASAQAQQPPQLPAAPYAGEYVQAPPMAGTSVAPATPAMECCPIRVVREHAFPSAKHAYRCHGGPIKQTLCVDNPADGCKKYYAVPVCVPACCTGEPRCCGAKVGLMGRGYVTYRWPCGFEATIAFRVHGGVIIDYH